MPALPEEPTLDANQRAAVRQLLSLTSTVHDLGSLFEEAGEEIALVGGPVRDALLRRLGDDWDLATSARPDVTERLVRGWADAVWDIGRAYGTIGCRKDGHRIEITTYRSESYDPLSRNPGVAYGDTLEGDLSRRDFTANAMAVRLPGGTFVDPFGGRHDLARRVLRTPGTPQRSFADDPLRMMRAARFVAQLGFDAGPEVIAAMRDMADRLGIVAAERIRDELVKLINGQHPRRGLQLMVGTGVADHVLPELSALKLERDEHHRHKDVYEHTLTVLEQAMKIEDRLPDGGPDFVTRFAALMHDVGKPRTRRFADDGSVTFHHHDVVGAKLTRKRMRALRFSTEVTESVAMLVELHLRFHGYGTGEWTDSAVRRYVRDAGPHLQRLHVLTRADCTTRNRRKAERLRRSYNELEQRVEQLMQEEELAAIRPDLDGNQIMSLLGLAPGRVVGEAYRYLLELRMEHGPLGEERARDELVRWWAARE